MSRESATCRLIENNSSVTFPINATHSGMVKFTKDHHYYHVVVSKLRTILSVSLEERQGTPNTATTPNRSDLWEDLPLGTGSQGPNRLPVGDRDGRKNSKFNPHGRFFGRIMCCPSLMTLFPLAELDSFRRITGLAASDQRDFANTTFAQVEGVVRDIQSEQERQGSLMYMRRLQPFLVSMQQFHNTAQRADAFVELPLAIAYIWVSITKPQVHR